VFGWLQADTVAAVWIAAAAIHREKNTVEAAAGLQPQQAAANKVTNHTRHTSLIVALPLALLLWPVASILAWMGFVALLRYY
jgi:hypothetical protein